MSVSFTSSSLATNPRAPSTSSIKKTSTSNDGKRQYRVLRVGPFNQRALKNVQIEDKSTKEACKSLARKVCLFFFVFVPVLVPLAVVPLIIYGIAHGCGKKIACLEGIAFKRPIAVFRRVFNIPPKLNMLKFLEKEEKGIFNFQGQIPVSRKTQLAALLKSWTEGGKLLSNFPEEIVTVRVLENSGTGITEKDLAAHIDENNDPIHIRVKNPEGDWVLREIKFSSVDINIPDHHALSVPELIKGVIAIDDHIKERGIHIKERGITKEKPAIVVTNCWEGLGRSTMINSAVELLTGEKNLEEIEAGYHQDRPKAGAKLAKDEKEVQLLVLQNRQKAWISKEQKADSLVKKTPKEWKLAYFDHLKLLDKILDATSEELKAAKLTQTGWKYVAKTKVQKLEEKFEKVKDACHGNAAAQEVLADSRFQASLNSIRQALKGQPNQTDIKNRLRQAKEDLGELRFEIRGAILGAAMQPVVTAALQEGASPDEVVPPMSYGAFAGYGS